MSGLSITPFFRFCRAKLVELVFNPELVQVALVVCPNEHFTPICSHCGKPVSAVHSQHWRLIRDLPICQTHSYLIWFYRKLRCPRCGVRAESQEATDTHQRVTRRLAQYVSDLCQHMTVKDVARHLGLNRKTVKAIDKQVLKERYATIDWQGVKTLAIDEIAIRRGHRYLTVVMDYDSGRVLWMGRERTRATMDEFFTQMPAERRAQIEAVAMDLWPAYIGAVQYWCPQAQIVFDEFHVIKDYNEVIDQIRRREYAKANKTGKDVLQGNRFLLLKNLEHLDAQACSTLQTILKLNESLTTAYVLRDQLRLIFQTRDCGEALFLLWDWCQLAEASGVPALRKFARHLMTHAYGIVNHAAYPIDNGKLEGSNNKIKVIKRKAYGFRDTDYFILKVKQAFDHPKSAT